MTNIYQQWLEAKAAESAARATRLEIEKQICEAHEFDKTFEGVATHEVEDYTVKITGRITRKVDVAQVREIATECGLTGQLENLFRWKCEIDARNWKAAGADTTDVFLPAIESKPGKPAVTVVPKEDSSNSSQAH